MREGPVTTPQFAYEWMRVLESDPLPRLARLIWQMTIRLLIGYFRMKCAISECALGFGSWKVRQPFPSYNAMPQPSLCGPVAPPRRINPAKLKQISVGTLASIPSNSHKL